MDNGHLGVTHVDSSFIEKTINVIEKKQKPQPGSIWASKEGAAFSKIFSYEESEEFLGKSTEDLKKIISYCTVEMKDQISQVEANEEYKKAKADLKVFSDSLREINKPLKAKIQFAAFLLKDRSDR